MLERTAIDGEQGAQQTSVPFARSCAAVYSPGAWLMPPTLGPNTMAIGATLIAWLLAFLFHVGAK